MNPFITGIVSAWLALVSLVSADSNTTWRGSGDITFSGTSTLHAWSGKVSTEPFTAFVIIGDDRLPKSLKAKAEVKAAAMDTAEPDRDKKMRESMKVITFPLIAADFDVAFTGNKTPPETLPFDLKLLGKTQKIVGTISHWKSLNDQQVTFDVDFDLSLKTSGIKVPSVLLVVRVGDTIKVRASITLKRVKV